MDSDDALEAAVRLSNNLKGIAGRYCGEYFDGIIRYGATGDATYEVDIPIEEGVEGFFSEAGLPVRVMSEDAGTVDYSGNPEYIFLIDPLDGSRNMRRGLPFYCSSIAVYEAGACELGQAVAAVINRFDADEMFTATAGGGAFLNGREIRPSPKESLEDSILALGSHFTTTFPVYAPYCEGLSNLTGADERGMMVKCLGATALELAYLAAGRIDIIFDIRARTGYGAALKTYDVAAGILIARQAGAIIEYGGGDKIPDEVALDPGNRVSLFGAGNRGLFKRLSNTLQ
jgi:myo-inositol-1(or 4)-monophosphatase